MATRTCAVCRKFNLPLADCPHPGRIVPDPEPFSYPGPSVFRAGFSVSAPKPEPMAVATTPEPLFRTVLVGHHSLAKLCYRGSQFVAGLPFTTDELAVIRPYTWRELFPNATDMEAAVVRGEKSLASYATK